MEKSGYVNVDELQAGTTLEEAAAKCGLRLDAKQSGSEVRIDCPFSCPGDHAGRREVSISTDNPQKVFYCHAYQCQLRGNLLTLMHGWLTAKRPTGDKLKGEEFNRVKRVLVGTTPVASLYASAQPPPEPPPSVPPARSVALQDSDDENVRKLAIIDEKFVTDVAAMHPAAAAYVRRHPCLSSESMKKWRVGYLPLDGGGDKRGWSLRGHIIYPLLAEDGKVLAWIGRDPAFEDKEREFLRLLPEERAKEKPPQKHKVPAGFARGQHLFGQHAARLREPGYCEYIAEHGIIVVEGFNDVIGLDGLGVPAVGLCSNRMTEEQADKIMRFAKTLSDGMVTLLMDCDDPGDDGAKEALWLLTQRGLRVRLGWTQWMHGGAFKGRQPEHLTKAEGHVFSSHNVVQ
jgi:5S rRNA maturation endonuclease (ribonuclease M5)